MAADVDGTLAAVAEIGYAEVELAGLYGLTARQMREKLDVVGLRAASSHHGIELVREGWDQTLEDAQELGQRLIVVPGLPGDERTRDGISRIADDFNRGGEMASSAGLRFGYHNHDWEFDALEDGTIPMEHLLDRTDADFVDWQMDVFWTVHGGADPFEQLSRRAGRVSSIHVKDRTSAGDMVDVGDGVIDFGRFIPEAERQGMLHAFVEHDRPGDAIDSVRRSFRHLIGGRSPDRPRTDLMRTDTSGRDPFDERTA
jgi:sugar phosphate isomerase/epimerase